MVRRLGLILGIMLMVAGVAVIGNVGWHLYGTGIATAHQQHRLAHQFQAAAPPTTATPPTTKPREVAAADVLPAPPPTQPQPALGTLIGHLVIPKIGVSNYVVEGVGDSQLSEGTGHYPGTAPIGGIGNVGIAGHRTTYGAPFFNLNKVEPGDLIYLTNLAHVTYTYRVVSQTVVGPNDVAVLDSTTVRSLTLTTCNPRYSATTRLVVHAVLV